MSDGIVDEERTSKSKIRTLLFFGTIIFVIVFQGKAASTMNRVLYRSPSFTVTDSDVRQGEFRAAVQSRDRIVSDYAGIVKFQVPRVITFKFSLNGKDNERPPYQDHRIIVDPGAGLVKSPVIVFGADDPYSNDLPDVEERFLHPGEEIDIVFRVDMNHVLSSFRELGYFECYDGSRIEANNFDGVFIAGGTPPLSWDFNSLPERPDLRLNDTDGDGIYEQTIHFGGLLGRPIDESGNAYWERTQDLSEYPSYTSQELLVDALYNLSLEELILNIRPDGTFMAGKEWTGVWTRDISYSILLSLALIDPEGSMNSLKAKVKDGRIIQDTGTGGSWPVSTDRMTWALAAWEVYKSTGDKDWLEYAFDVIRRSVQADSVTIFDESTGLVFGESSFLDWREQTYPRWMAPVDIYQSQCLGTNAVHYQTYRILETMAMLLGHNDTHYGTTADAISRGINNELWVDSRGYYGQFRYGRIYPALSPRMETLGEALTILFGIASPDRARSIIENGPVLPFGTPCIYPQIPGIPPYHNNGIWPFVQAFWTWSAAETGNGTAVEYGMASLFRAAGLFLTNKENMVADTGDYTGTEINSDRQLWSVAGTLAMPLRILMGIRLFEDRLELHPCISEAYNGQRTLRNLKYRDSILDITLTGFGNIVETIRLDGTVLETATVPASLAGRHTIDIQMANNSIPGAISLVDNHTTIETPWVSCTENMLEWIPIQEAVSYDILRNGVRLKATDKSLLEIQQEGQYTEYQVAAVDAHGFLSFLSEPIGTSIPVSIVSQPDIHDKTFETRFTGFTGLGYLVSRQESPAIPFSIHIHEPGWYRIDIRYANGSGPINTDNKCALRTLIVDDTDSGIVVMPQRGTDAWDEWGYSSNILLFLYPGDHEIRLSYEHWNRNMNGVVDIANIDHLRARLISKKGN